MNYRARQLPAVWHHSVLIILTYTGLLPHFFLFPRHRAWFRSIFLPGQGCFMIAQREVLMAGWKDELQGWAAASSLGLQCVNYIKGTKYFPCADEGRWRDTSGGCGMSKPLVGIGVHRQLIPASSFGKGRVLTP